MAREKQDPEKTASHTPLLLPKPLVASAQRLATQPTLLRRSPGVAAVAGTKLRMGGQGPLRGVGRRRVR